ncbi:hypothetical protein ICJ57_04425 [Geoglobus acetivorans]|nr:hypothetical protein [Geoglobus acetivorans]
MGGNVESILEDLRYKVERIEKMVETLIDIYADTLYEVREEYLEKLEKIRKEDFEEFSDINELRRLIEEG